MKGNGEMNYLQNSILKWVVGSALLQGRSGG
jgi:hypothetical protein